MGIHEDLFKSFYETEFASEVRSSMETFSSVEEKVEDLRKRVALNAIDTKQIPEIKTASLKATASKQEEKTIRLFKKANDKNVENELKSYLMQLIDQRRAGIDAIGGFYQLREQFPQHSEFLKNNKQALLDFISKYQAKYLNSKEQPKPISSNQFDSESDKKTFQNIADKI